MIPPKRQNSLQDDLKNYIKENKDYIKSNDNVLILDYGTHPRAWAIVYYKPTKSKELFLPQTPYPYNTNEWAKWFKFILENECRKCAEETGIDIKRFTKFGLVSLFDANE